MGLLDNLFDKDDDKEKKKADFSNVSSGSSSTAPRPATPPATPSSASPNVADREKTFILSGSGDVVEPDHGIAAVGSGGHYALAAARALMEHTQLSAREVAQTAMGIAADIDIYTNANLSFEEL